MTRPGPEAPEGVRVAMRDGRVLDVECVYIGVINNLHTWEVAYPLAGNLGHVQVRALPDQTVVVLNGTARPR